MNRRSLAVLILGTAIGVLLASASGAGGSPTKSGGTFRLATSSGIDSLNPYVAFNQDAYSMFEYIYPLLVQYDKDNKQFVPDFARAWTASKDGKTWTFTTVAGAKWSDGKPLTAADAAWTINTDIKYQGGGAANAAGLIAHIKHASAPKRHRSRRRPAVTPCRASSATTPAHAPAQFPIGATVVTWTVTHIHGNTATCQQTITVVDNEPPTIACPAPVSVNAAPGARFARCRARVRDASRACPPRRPRSRRSGRDPASPPRRLAA